MSKHTKGTWYITDEKAQEPEIRAGEYYIAQCFGFSDLCGNSGIANARLIAAAPDLLKVCQYIEGDGRMFNALDGREAKMLQAAIAKAMGKEQ